MRRRARREAGGANIFRRHSARWLTALSLLLLAAPSSSAPPQPANAPDSARLARVVDTAAFGVERPAGLTWSRKAESFLLLTPDPTAAPLRVTHKGRLAGSHAIGARLPDPRNVAFDNKAHRLLAFDVRRQQLIASSAGSDGMPSARRPVRIPARRYGLTDPQGMSVDPVTGRVFLLDGNAQRIVVVEPGLRGGLRRASISTIQLSGFGRGPLRGLAFDPASGHLHVYRPADRQLYELADTGRVVMQRDLSRLGIRDPQALVFAPSGDLTDDPHATSLYVAEATEPGRIVELSVAAPAAALPQAGATGTTLVQVIDTSLFSPPSPDPMGITMLGGSDHLLMSDSEVEEIPALFAGENLFEIDPLSGALVGTSNTIPFSLEPTGLAYNPIDAHVFASDDDADEVFEIDPGPDATYGTGDDSITSFDTSAFNSTDPEGVAYDPVEDVLYVADGLNSEVYVIEPGLNGSFDGVPPLGDDQVSSFDTLSIGIRDPEGIVYDADNGFLYLSGKSSVLLYHVTPSGGLVRTLDVSTAEVPNPSGLAFGPGSQEPASNHLYVCDRGKDNDSLPGENDGQVFEFAVPPITPGNLPPDVDAGPDQPIVLPDAAVLAGSATDALIPGGTLILGWSLASGPGSVFFGDASQLSTTASFSSAGTYTLRLTADDGELFGFDETSVVVTGSAGETVTEIPISTGFDDAEEIPGGTISLASSDLEFTFDHGFNQTVGMRFAGVDVPRDAPVVTAFVQFHVDEPNTETTTLAIQGEATGNAATFTSSSFNITSRPTTSAWVSWNPAPWTQTGDATPEQRTPELASVVEEIVSRPDWSSGNALALIAIGLGERTAISFDKDPASAATLHVAYLQPPNTPPLVSLSSPPEGALYDEGESIGFVGTANDDQDGDVTPDLAWSSDLDGPIGVGGSFARSDLSPGIHTVTASVTDSGGLLGSAQRSFSVNGRATLTITSPADGSVFIEGDPITFLATANDPEDGDLAAALTWSSSLEGEIGSGGGFTRADLTPGLHTITAALIDSGGLPASAQVDLTIQPNTPPIASLTSPPDGSIFVGGDAISFAGSASDAEDGDLTGSLSWSSSRDGSLGSGGSFSRTDLSVGTHTITASVSDSGGLQDAVQVDLEVVAGCAGPDVDGDGVGDACDNCIEAANLSQTDSNGDGYGNACDADYDDSGSVGLPDFGELSSRVGMACGDPQWDPDLDSNDDCVIGLPELGLVADSFGAAPGPSAFAP